MHFLGKIENLLKFLLPKKLLKAHFFMHSKNPSTLSLSIEITTSLILKGDSVGGVLKISFHLNVKCNILSFHNMCWLGWMAFACKIAFLNSSEKRGEGGSEKNLTSDAVWGRKSFFDEFWNKKYICNCETLSSLTRHSLARFTFYVKMTKR